VLGLRHIQSDGADVAVWALHDFPGYDPFRVPGIWAAELATGGVGIYLLVADRSAIKRVASNGGIAIVPAGHGLRTGNTPSVSLVSAIVPLKSGDALVLDENENVLLRLSY